MKRCVYCDTTVTHTSTAARVKHKKGKKHLQKRNEYWLKVAKKLGKVNASASIENPRSLKSLTLDQTRELNFKVPGLSADFELQVTLPPPANIPTAKFPKNFL